MNKTIWSKEWPTKPGRYWLYGWTSNYIKSKRKKKPELMYVDVYEIGIEKTSLAFICKGGLIYKRDGADGLWAPIDLPELPSEQELCM
ncbi:MAG: hypothetical protein M0R50_11185 [Candidatus Cloacimonetes bacterium]|jgi:hypothetical protein|nr:hypothetical protein [Candidatus Cloacimonadota bacterium]